MGPKGFPGQSFGYDDGYSDGYAQGYSEAGCTD